jgi:UDP-glucose 4-epimerase
MRVLITGGAGFIGSHLAELCLARGDEVYIIDNLSTGSLDNLQHLRKHPSYSKRLHITVDTIFSHEVMLNLVGTCDAVFHLAAAVGVKYILDNPLSSMTTNVRGTDIVLELCQRFRKRLLLASTSEVYGKHEHAPLLETDDCIFGSPDKFRWSYAASKLIDEFSAMAYHRVHQLPVSVARLFNVIGPRQTGRYGMVVPRFIDQAMLNEDITVYGDGLQSRTFTHVGEVVEILARLIDSPSAYGQVVNVGGVQEVSIFDLAQKIKQWTGSSSQIKIVPYAEVYPEGFEDMRRRVPSTRKLKELIGIAPVFNLDEILELMICDRSKQSSSGAEHPSENYAPPLNIGVS